MSEQEHKEYNREYRAEGFGKLADRRYYCRHRERHNERSRAYYAAHREELAARALAKHHARRAMSSH